jgi:hypothetical protein
MKKIAIIIQILFISSFGYSQLGNLQITYMHNLDFQQIIPGVSKTITETSPYAGKFIVTGNGTKMTVSVTFNLTQSLTDGSKSIPVKYTATHSANPNDNQPGIPFDPYVGTTLIFDDKTKEHYIKIGGVIKPPLVQLSGNYSSPVIIILTVVSN